MTSTQKITIKAGVLVVMMSLASMANANFVENKDYRVLEKPENITSDVVVVREFFWYGCPHCYTLEPHMQKWAKTRADDVAFFQTPAAMNPVWEQNARGFYASQMMGLTPKIHAELFDSIHKDGKKLYDQESLGNWYATQGLDKARFDSLYNSFAVTTKVERSKAAAQRYQIAGVPAVVVHGKYVVPGSDANVIPVVDFLVNKVRAENAAAKGKADNQSENKSANDNKTDKK